MMYELPASLEIGGIPFEIRSDYRAVLDIMAALSDLELSEEERAFVVLDIFYPDFEHMEPPDYREAIEKCFWFISGGEEDASGTKEPKLVDWEKDFPRIVSPINRIMGVEIRSIPYLHWWTFLSAYMEIGDCLFAQIVAIRSKKAKGKKLDKQEQEFYRKNHNIVDFKQPFTEAEQTVLGKWTGAKPQE